MFAHSPDGVPLSVVYDDLLYYYVTNLQGDVVALLDAAGNEVVTYTYDAWGNLLSVGGSKATTLGQDNPLRYRGYVYDQETGLYYLQSRYYDPEMGRFINADAFVSTGQGILGNNMFAYCGNNPVCRYDVGGLFWKELVRGILHVGNSLVVAIGIDTAAIGAFFLQMELDDNGVYHASVNCWQQYAGYNEYYDIAFDVGTSMLSDSFTFSYRNQGYTIWAWKGDYINLGAGAELGIYRGSSGHRTVDKALASYMGICVAYNNKLIIEH